MIRVLIIEDEIIIARFIEQQLLKHFSCKTAIALSYKEVKETVRDFIPHLLICDINLEEETSGLEIVAELQMRLSFETVFISSYQSLEIIKRATSMQPANYMVKPVNELDLFAGLQIAFEKVKASETAGQLKKEWEGALTEMERKIVGLIARRMTTREIAQAVHLSPYTIKNYRHSICHKLGLDEKNNALLRWALAQKNI